MQTVDTEQHKNATTGAAKKREGRQWQRKPSSLGVEVGEIVRISEMVMERRRSRVAQRRCEVRVRRGARRGCAFSLGVGGRPLVIVLRGRTTPHHAIHPVVVATRRLVKTTLRLLDHVDTSTRPSPFRLEHGRVSSIIPTGLPLIQSPFETERAPQFCSITKQVS
ncbi:hypothetical protein B296_00034569 [Ensete ventricosum]|uniref:Uncharacterized protein n=1 Tax=Ensete ventricosum TaxID=4639 RepID=A0A426Z254_ENSVE|nr:hypothetical protein B296_00034569 [Ensete ventricosum]